MDVAEHRAYETVIDRAADIALRDPNAFIEMFVRDDKNKPIVQAQLHRDMQAEWSRSAYSVMAVPRFHGKTTQALARVAWEIINNRNIRILLVAATDELAADRVETVKGILGLDEKPGQSRLRACYPWVKPAETRSQARGKFTVERPATHTQNATVRGVGIFGSATGKHANLILLDDPVTMRNALTHPAERKKVIDAFFLDFFPMIGPEARLWYIGTPWHDADLTSRLMSGQDTEKKPDLFRRVVTEELISPWPEFWTSARLLKRKRQVTAGSFARAYHLQTVSEHDAVCRPEDITYENPPESKMVVLGVDPASREHGKADYTAISILEIHDDHALLRDVIRDRMPFPEQIKLIQTLRKDYRPTFIAVPTTGMQKTYLDELVNQGVTQAIGVQEIKSKYSRFRILGLRLAQRTLRLSQVGDGLSSGVAAFVAELLGFPAAEHDDTLDATMFAMAAAEEGRLIEPSGDMAVDDDEEIEDDGRSLGDLGLDIL